MKPSKQDQIQLLKQIKKQADEIKNALNKPEVYMKLPIVAESCNNFLSEVNYALAHLKS